MNTFQTEAFKFMGLLGTRLLGTRGSFYASGTDTLGAPAATIIVQEDSVIAVLTGSDDVDYVALYNLGTSTLKAGALITAPEGVAFKVVTLTSGAIIGYP